MTKTPQDPTPLDLDALREPVRRFVARLVRDADAADDVVSETLLVVLDRVRQGEPLRNPRAFAFQTAWFKARASLRKKRPAAWSTAAEERLAYDPRRYRELREWVLCAYDRLAPEMRALLALRYEARLGHREIAEVLDCPLGSVGGRLAEAEAALERSLRHVGRGEELPFAIALLPAALALDPVATAAPVAASGTASFSFASLLLGIAMKKTTIVTLVVALAGGVGWWMSRSEDDISTPRDRGRVLPAPDTGTLTPDERGPDRPAPKALEPVQSEPFEAPRPKPNTFEHTLALQQIEVSLGGRVVDRSRRPVAGATISLFRLPSGPEITESDAEGRYVFRFAQAALNIKSVSLHVAHPEHGAMVASVSVGTPGQHHYEVVTLALRPAAGIRARTLRGSDPVPAQIRMRLPSLYSAGAKRVELGPFATDARGEVLLPPIPETPFRLLAHDERGGVAERELSLRGPEGRVVEIALDDGAWVEVTVTDERSGRPVAGAAVSALEIRPPDAEGQKEYLTHDAPGDLPLTDAAGRTRLSGLLAGSRVSVRATSPRHFRRLFSPQGVEVVAGKNELAIAVPGERTMRFPLAETDPPPPGEGTPITIRRSNDFVHGLHPPAEGRIEEGELVVPGWPATFSGGMAVAPDGRVASLMAMADKDRGRAIRFGPPVMLDVRVLDAEGRPAADVTAELKGRTGGLLHAVAKTDSEGRARLGPLLRRSGQVTLRLPAREGPGTILEAGTPDWKAEQPSLEVNLGRTVEARILFRKRGVPALPPDLRILIQGLPPEVQKEDPQKGLVTITLRLAPRLPAVGVFIRGAGVDRVLTLEVPAGETVVTRTFDWNDAPSARVRTTPPRDGELSLMLMYWSKHEKRWRDHYEHRPAAWEETGGAERTAVFKGITAGRWRVVDRVSGQLSAPFSVDPEGRPAEVSLDLGEASWVRGRVIGPAGCDFAKARVSIAEGDGSRREAHRILETSRLRSRSFGVKPDGSFRVRVSGQHPTRLSVEHDVLRPHPERGHVTATRFPATLQLELHDGPSVRFELRRPSGRWLGIDNHVTLHAFSGDVSTKPAWSTNTSVERVEKQQVELPDIRPGRWTLWFDVAGFAPIVLEDRTLADGPNDLGTLEPDRGVALDIRFDGAGKEGVRGLRATAISTAKDAPRLRRRGYATRLDGLTVYGLVPGRWDVVISLMRQDRSETYTTTVDVPSVERHEVRVPLQ